MHWWRKVQSFLALLWIWGPSPLGLLLASRADDAWGLWLGLGLMLAAGWPWGTWVVHKIALEAGWTSQVMQQRLTSGSAVTVAALTDAAPAWYSLSRTCWRALASPGWVVLRSSGSATDKWLIAHEMRHQQQFCVMGFMSPWLYALGARRWLEWDADRAARKVVVSKWV